MDVTAIASASIDMHLEQAVQDVGIAMLKKAMDSSQAQAAALLEVMQPVSFGHQLDRYI